MSENKTDERPWQSDYNWLSKRIDRVETEMREQCRLHSRRMRLLVRIFVDKKIIGEEVAKSIEETLKKEGGDTAILNWFNEELTALKKDLEKKKPKK